MEYSKEFVTSVVLGKDLVPRYLLHLYIVNTLLKILVLSQSHLLLLSPRLGLSQLEGFRRHLLEVLQKSNKPKVSLFL